MFNNETSSNEAVAHKKSDGSNASNLFMLTGNRRSDANYHSNLDLTSNEFLAFLERMQSQRLDDQRCEMPDIHVSTFLFLFFFRLFISVFFL
ncbi:hypothetical protein X798_07567 [Onchocerca flexuosa]|uniref:Uncharacterized protein n=1 Tax=Onchocerca flexuosa TaxID=387005 RepID=A0A238BJ17_9BILA|nr:hypothetical protein X798_07567 [Onchocerca flexuosa]